MVFGVDMRGKFCLDCGKKICQVSKRCSSCSAKDRRARGCYDTPECRVKLSVDTKAAHARGCFDSIFTPEVRKRKSEEIKAAWARGAFANRDSIEYREKISKGLKEAHARGCFDGISDKMKEAWARGVYAERETPELRAKKRAVTKARWARGDMDTPEIRAKRSKGAKRAWARGDFDGVFASPTNPEKIIKKFLEERGIEHEFQFHLGRFYYDFYIPNRNLLVEYDGTYWHSLPGAKERDEEKTALALEKGYMLTRLQSTTESEVSIRFLAERGLGIDV